jgi:hypothetical protein
MDRASVKRGLAALILLGVSPILPARAATVCPYFTAGWSQQWSNQPILFASWDSTTQLLYIVFATGQVSAFSNVPLGVIQSFSNLATGNPMPYYQSIVQPNYHALLLSAPQNCPIKNESGGYLWTD